VINDLTDAVTKLPTTWSDAQRGKATSYAASALLAKVYLYQKRYDLVVSTLQPLATAIYAGTVLAVVPQTTTFPSNLKTSKDIIFAVQYLNGGVGEAVNVDNRYRNNNNTNSITIPQAIFENTDNRKALLTPTGTGARPGKFNSAASPSTEISGDFPVLRCADVLLMYAEALNEVAYGNSEAFKALNAVRTNAGITAKTAIDLPSQASFRTEVYLQRRLELALEADRWFDIVRTNQMATIFRTITRILPTDSIVHVIYFCLRHRVNAPKSRNTSKNGSHLYRFVHIAIWTCFGSITRYTDVNLFTPAFPFPNLLI
jgi:hypothetical protein